MIQAIDKFIYLQSAVFIMVHYYELLSRHMFEALRNSGGNRLKNNHVMYYVITQVGDYAEQWYVLRPT